MKKTLLILLMLSMAVVATAQTPRNSKNRGEAVAIGIRGGAILSSFVYPEAPALDTLRFDVLGSRIHPVLGVNVEFPLMNGLFYIAPEIDLAERGDRRVYHSDLWNTDVKYKVKVNYLEARLPMSVAVPVNSWLKVYFFAAPSFGLTLPTVGPLTSEISLLSTDNPQSINNTVAIDSSNMAPYDVGMMSGAGLRFTFTFSRFSLVLKTEVGYYRGRKDTYSLDEHYDQAPAVNVNAYNISGSRNNRGLEAAITIALPLKFAPGDACSRWSNGVYPSSRHYNHGF